MKFVSVILLFIFSPFLVSSQTNPFYVPQNILNRDSLENVIENTNDELKQLEAYRELGFIYYENKRDSALYYFEKSILLAQKTNRKLWEADACNSFGFICYIQGNFPRALQYLLQAKKIAEDPASEKNTWSSGDMSKVSPGSARLSILARTHNHLASMYGMAGNYRDNAALEFVHFKEALRLSQQIDEKRMESIVHMNLGRHYAVYPDKLDSTLYFANIALEQMRENGYTRYKGIILSYIGNAYMLQKQYGLARDNYQQAIQASMEIKNFRSLADAYLALSNVYRDAGQIDSSLIAGKNALETYQTSSLPKGIVNAYVSLAKTFQLKNNIDSAFHYQSLAMKAREDLNADEQMKQFQQVDFDERLRVQQLDDEKKQLQNRMMNFALLAGIAVLMLIAFILFRNNRARRKANNLLEVQKQELQSTLTELKSAQAQLIHAEKMASLGELTAGIAHEIQNPLNFVNNFSDLNTELIEEMRHALLVGDAKEALQIALDVQANQDKISNHGKRADTIVKGMLQHSRSSTGQKEKADINKIADEYLHLAYHGLRAKDKEFNITMETRYDPAIESVNIIPQDIGRVLLNLYNNAFYSVTEKKKISSFGYEPIITVVTKKLNDSIEVKVKDNGMGISEQVRVKIFQPFFTTKPTGQGTGLGLSLSYDIIKAHGGTIKVDSIEGDGSVFTILLPIA
jgi:two-component system NtrC family sensor kinase